MTHKITLPNTSALLLVNVLSCDGWAATVPDIIQAGSLLAETFKDFEMKKDTDGKPDREWLKQTREWEMTERQRECCKRAISGVTAIKKMPTGEPAYLLAKAFGFE